MMTGAAVFIVLLVGYVFFYNQLARLDALAVRAWNKLNNCFARRRELSGRITDYLQTRGLPTENILSPAENDFADDVRRRQEYEIALSDKMQTLLTRAEKQLADDGAFRQMQKDWATAEDDLQNARRRYNAAVRDYNVALHTFPSCFVGKSIKAKEKVFFKTGDGSNASNKG